MGLLSQEERERYEINPLIAICYDYIFPITEELMLATHGQSISLVHNSGNVICTHDSIELNLYVEKEFPERIENVGSISLIGMKMVYVEDFLRIRDNGLYGLIDLDGNIVLPAIYRHLEFEGKDSISRW